MGFARSGFAAQNLNFSKGQKDKDGASYLAIGLSCFCFLSCNSHFNHVTLQFVRVEETAAEALNPAS